MAVALGQFAECTAANAALPGRLTLRKSVDNASGGAAAPDWVLSATPLAGPEEAVTISGRHGQPQVTNAEAVPGVRYALDESGGPAGYVQTGPVSCAVTGAGTPVATPGQVLTVGIGADVTCTFANRFTAPIPVTGAATGRLAGAGIALLFAGAGLRIAGRRTRRAR